MALETNSPITNAAPVEGRGWLRHEIALTLRMAAPLAITQLGMMAMGVVDTLMVGRLGAVALASVALANALYMTLGMFFGGIIFSIDPIVAQSFGAQKHERCGSAVWSGLWVGAACSIPLTVLFLNPEPVLPYLGQEPQVTAEAAGYLKYRAWAMLPFLAFAAWRGLLNGIGDLRPVLLITIVANVINLVADWALIFGHLGAPEMGVRGAALATTIVRWAMLFAMTAWMCLPRYRRYNLTPQLPSLARIRQILRLGLPIGAQISVEIGVFNAVAVLIGWLGAVALGAHAITMSIASLAFMVPLGVSIAASIRVGQALGRGSPAAAAAAGRAALVVGTGFMVVTATTMALIPETLARLFTADQAVIALAVGLIQVAAAFQIFDGAQVVGCGCLRGTGDTRTPLLANLVAHWCVGLPLGYYLAFHTDLGARGLWAGLTVGLALVSVALMGRFLRGGWQSQASLVEA